MQIVAASLLSALLNAPAVTVPTPIADALEVARLKIAVHDSTRAKVDDTLAIVSLSASAVAAGLTASCISARECRELNPVMARVIGDHGPGAFVIVKTVINGALVWVVKRFMPEGKTRTWTLAIVAGMNALDAAWDIREMRKVRR